jgi:S1-C subfamily serine protease
MFRTPSSLLLALIAVVVVACEQASDLIPGDGEATPDATAGATTATPIVIPPDLETGTDTPTPTPAIADHELARSVVQIQTVDSSSGFVRTVHDGSGVIVDREAGLILTAYPVVRPYLSSGARAYTSIAIGVNDGNGGSPRLEFEADLIAADDLLGLAVLRVTREYQGDPISADSFSFPGAEPGDGSTLEPGDALRLFGHPGLEASNVDSQVLLVTEGTVTGRRGEPDHPGTTKLKLDALLPYGNTGGPAFSSSGTLVGLLVPEHYDNGAPVTQIRPFNLATELIESARALPSDVEFLAPLHAEEPPAGFDALLPSDGIWVSRPLFAENATQNAGALDLYDYERGFLSGTEELFFEFAVQGAPAGAAVEERWLLNGVLQDSLSSSYAWEGGEFAIVADQIGVPAAAAALPNGRWSLEVHIDGALRASSTAIVGIDLDPPLMLNPVFGSVAGASGVSLAGPVSTAQQILFFFDYAGMDITQGVRWVVLRDGELMYQSPEIRWPAGGSGRFWVGYSDEEAVGPGRWSFQVLVDGQLLLESEWDVV